MLKNLNALVLNVLELEKVWASKLEDGKISTPEAISGALQSIDELTNLVKIDYKEALAEALKANPVEQAEFVALFKAHFDIKDNVLEAQIEEIAGYVLPLVSLAQQLVAAYKILIAKKNVPALASAE